MKYISINSVLYNLSLSVDESTFDETRFLEYALQGYRKMESSHKYIPEACLIAVSEHKATVPSNAVHIIQAAYKATLSDDDLASMRQLLGIDEEPTIADPDNLATMALDATLRGMTGWKPMRPSSNSFLSTITETESIFPSNVYFPQVESCIGCTHEYSIDPSMCMTTTLRQGLVYISYLTWVTDSDGRYLIPDDENLKEALFHYCMYRYHMSRIPTKENESRMTFHLKQYELLKAKAQANLNQPTVDQMENIKNMTSRLVPRTNRFEGFFSQLTNKENIGF